MGFKACVFLLILLVSSCQKIKEDIALNFILDAMTDGEWVVEKFTEANEDITHQFKDFYFKFERNEQVFAKKEDGSSREGAWKGDVKNLTITSSFTGAGDPLVYLNDIWLVTKNTKQLVEAKPFESNRIAFLKLVKRQ